VTEPPADPDDLAALESEISALEAIEDIKRLHRTYVRYLAGRSWQELDRFFTHDADVQIRNLGVRRGQAELKELFADMSRQAATRDGYILSSPAIAVDGDHATGVWTLHRHVCEFPAGRMVRVYGPWWEGRYDCEYRRAAGGWRISRLRFRVVLPDRDPETAAGKGRVTAEAVAVLGATRPGWAHE
jgi:hypothetical protein